jgi:hypothetical protein
MRTGNKVVVVILSVLVLMMLVVGSVIAGSGTLLWTDPNMRADGVTPFNSATDALKHTVYYGLQSTITPTNYDTKVDLGATITSLTLTTLPAGATTYAIVTITDKQNLESAPSNIASKTIPQSKPGSCSLQFN